MTPRNVGGAVALAVALGLAGVAASSCSTPESRYRVLSAVFDGVPPPPGMEVPLDEMLDGEASTLQQGLATIRANKPARPEPPKIVSVHKPVAENKCRECHDMDRPGQDIARDASLCDKCHLEERRAKGWDHGPINLGTCIPCHAPHESQYEHLLAVAMPGLCLNCHDQVTPAGPDYHRVENFDACTACHDPHRMY